MLFCKAGRCIATIHRRSVVFLKIVILCAAKPTLYVIAALVRGSVYLNICESVKLEDVGREHTATGCIEICAVCAVILVTSHHIQIMITEVFVECQGLGIVGADVGCSCLSKITVTGCRTGSQGVTEARAAGLTPVNVADNIKFKIAGEINCCIQCCVQLVVVRLGSVVNLVCDRVAGSTERTCAGVICSLTVVIHSVAIFICHDIWIAVCIKSTCVYRIDRSDHTGEVKNVV